MIRFLTLFFFWLCFLCREERPTIFIIGDSTVKAGKGLGENGMWGWGSVIDEHFDTSKIKIENHAIGGRSSRTFLTDGRWEPILEKMKEGDFLLIQFGHNDDWAINDTIRARGTINGIGDETEEIDNLLTHKHEVVHTYGWYLKKYATEAKQKGVEVFICSQVPFNRFENGKVAALTKNYPIWAAEIAEITDSHFIDLQKTVSKNYNQLNYNLVKQRYFTAKDDVHTNLEGAKLNAYYVVKGIHSSKSPLKKFLK